MRNSPHPGALRGRPLPSAPQTWKGTATPGPRLEGERSQVRRPGCQPLQASGMGPQRRTSLEALQAGLCLPHQT